MKALKGLVLGALVISGFGCASAAESACAKQAECATLSEGETEEQCVANGQKEIDKLREKEGCESVADKVEAYAKCLGGVSCEELKKGNDSTECKSEREDAVGAMLSNMEKCASAN